MRVSEPATTERHYPYGILVTYWEARKKKQWSTSRYADGFAALGLKRPALMIDSGVYTARSAGVDIDAREYAS